MQLATRLSTGVFARYEPLTTFMILTCTAVFFRACRRGVNLLVKPLLDAGADLEAKNKAGATPMIESARGLVCANLIPGNLTYPDPSMPTFVSAG